MKKIKTVLAISLILNFILILGATSLIVEKGGISYVYKKVSNITNKNNKSRELFPYYYDRKDLFAQLKTNNKDIVFLGDSLTDYNEWSEAFNNSNVLNRGIGGDRIWSLYDRLNEITEGKPNKIFIMVGINDLGAEENINSIIDYYDKIISNIQKSSPNTKLFIQSVLPVNTKKNVSALPKVKNNDVVKLNNQLKALTYKKNVTFINLYSLFVKNGELDSNLTTDGVHLKSNGYKIWETTINQYVNK